MSTARYHLSWRPVYTSFISCYSDQPDLHSFPTRRSSDLKKPPRFGGMKTYNWEGVNPDGYFLDKLEPIPSGLTPSQLDRKSGSAGMPRPISYAVFCLKKKKSYVRRQRTH